MDHHHISVVHQGQKRHKCESCSKSFSDASCLGIRFMEETETKHVKFKCHCSGPKITYVSHEKGKKNYKCSLCAKEFYRQDSLEKHIIVIHEGQK